MIETLFIFARFFLSHSDNLQFILEIFRELSKSLITDKFMQNNLNIDYHEFVLQSFCFMTPKKSIKKQSPMHRNKIIIDCSAVLQPFGNIQFVTTTIHHELLKCNIFHLTFNTFQSYVDAARTMISPHKDIYY